MADTGIDNRERVYHCLEGFLCVVLLMAVLYCIAAAVVVQMPPRRLDISIDSTAGLDLPPSKDLALDRPQFNLTFRLASSSLVRQACVDAGTYVVVSYHCVPLAAAGVAASRFCVGARGSVTMPIVATGAGVRMPGYVMDSIAADLRSGVDAFQVRLIKLVGDTYQDVAACGVRRVGDVAAECAHEQTCPDIIPATTQPQASSPLSS